MSRPERFDIAIIGAGPAGSVTAHQCATRGRSVLMLDKATFPRHKVCGCCLSHVGLAALKSCGLESAVRARSAMALHTFRLFVRGARLSVDVPPGLGISRAAMDQALIEAAVEAGVEFKQDVTASVGPYDTEIGGRRVTWTDQRGDTRRVEAQRVVLAGGLRSVRALQQSELNWREHPRSFIGCSTRVDDWPGVEPGHIDMVTGRGGYVGFSSLEDGRVDVAAALNPKASQQAGGVGRAIEVLLKRAGLQTPTVLKTARWQGTPRLTAKPDDIARPGLLLVGDAAGYIEPFTGEGMTWAILGGVGAAGVASDASLSASAMAEQWRAVHRQLLGRRQRQCRLLTALLRSERLTAMAVKTLNLSGRTRRAVVAALHRPSTELLPMSTGIIS